MHLGSIHVPNYIGIVYCFNFVVWRFFLPFSFSALSFSCSGCFVFFKLCCCLSVCVFSTSVTPVMLILFQLNLVGYRVILVGCGFLLVSCGFLLVSYSLLPVGVFFKYPPVISMLFVSMLLSCSSLIVLPSLSVNTMALYSIYAAAS